jgi:hypothetical protein
MENRLVGIVGPRGVGKTTFLLQYLREHYGTSQKALYISADNLYFTEHTLLETVRHFITHYGGEMLCIDEIHRYPNWNQELKNLYDMYPKLQILFSGSSSIDLIKGKYDLSRRVILRKMHGFSFREYLEYTTGESYPILTLKDILNPSGEPAITVGKTEKILGLLQEYWKWGYYPVPTSIKTYQAFRQTIHNIVEKTIYEDIPSFYNLRIEGLESLRKLLYFFATSQPGELSVNSLARSIGKDHTTISSYIQMLRNTGILRFLLRDAHGHTLVRNAEKVYLDNLNLLYAVNEEVGKDINIGTARELFVVHALQAAGHSVFYSQKGDIAVDKYTFEIGGRGKSESQLNGVKNGYVIADDLVYGSGSTIPLYLFGFLY